jgi:hypothetical protein
MEGLAVWGFVELYHVWWMVSFIFMCGSCWAYFCLLGCVAVSAVFVFAEGSSVACPAYLDACIFAFNYFYWGYYDGFTRGFAIGICPVKAWNRNRGKGTLSIRLNQDLFNLLKF